MPIEKESNLKEHSRLGAYQIVSPLGAGGMGEVYLAHDSRLNRDVALKLLPERFASDPDRLARFRREAQLLASLNHPNIAAIYGLEESGPQPCLVMEYVPGETLSERLGHAPGSPGATAAGRPAALGTYGPVSALPIDESLKIARQICDALEHAHEKGIIHRDLKPANIKVTPEGQVKVLDFGLAKAFAAGGPAAEEHVLLDSNSPTLPPDASPTIPGVILGTAAYMSPEQARGKTVDKRSDIWALGCVLYELLTGVPAFDGEDATDILASVVKSEPDWALLPAATPAGITRLLRRCLQKDARERLHDAADVRIGIEEALAAPATAPLTPVAAPAVPLRSRTLPWLAAVFVAAAAGIGAWMLKPQLPRFVSRLAITLPAGQHLAGLDQPTIAISPDGRNLVYAAIQDNPNRPGGEVRNGSGDQPPQAGARASDAAMQQLYLRPLGSQYARRIPGTEGAEGPFFSPDGRWIGFFAGGKLKKAALTGGGNGGGAGAGGGPVTLADAPQPGGASWSSQGTLAAQTVLGQGLLEVSSEGGAAHLITKLENGEALQRWPELLPGGKAVLFAGAPSMIAWNNAQIAVQSTENGRRTDLGPGTQPRYVPTGHLLYAQSGALMAAPFDLNRLTMTGAAVPAIEGVMQSYATGAAQYSVSSTGTLIYVAGGVTAAQNRMVWVSRNGEEQPVPAAAHDYEFPRIAPDGGRLAVTIVDQDSQVWVYDISRDTLTRLTFGGNSNGPAVWSPDGKRIAFLSNRAGPSNLFWQAADGSGTAERLTTSDYINAPNSFSPDGQLLAYIETTPETGRDIWVLNLKNHTAHPFLRTQYEESAPAFSSDGKWLAYCSDESGRREIYVQPYSGPGGKWQISTDGGQEPVWNPKGGELFYRNGVKMMAVNVETKPDFSAGKPRELFEGPYLTTPGSLPYYDVSPDGQRFLMLRPLEAQAAAPTQISVVLNWFEELKQKSPVR